MENNHIFYRFFLSFLLIGLSNSLALSQDSSKTLTPLQVAKIKHVENAVISPDGKTIAYTVTQPANPLKKNKPVVKNLYVRNIDDSTGVAFVTSMDVSHIRFRPAHHTITFLGKKAQDKPNALYQIGLKGGEAQKLLSFGRSITGYSWASDGNKIGFVVINPAPKIDNDLPYQPELYEENMPQRRGYITNVTQKGNKPRKLNIKGSIYKIKWSPSGKYLAVAVAPTSRIDDYYMNQKMVITSVQGDSIKAYVDHAGKLGQIEWSPDGEHLAMLAGADIHDPTAGRLFVVSNKGGAPTMLSPDFKGKFEQVEWADSTTIRYLSSKGVWSTFGSIGIDGTEMRTSIAPGKAVLEHFSQADSNRTTVFLAETATHPQELYLMKSGEHKPHRITNTNSWLGSITMGNQKVVTWKTEGNKDLQGILIYPIHYVEGNIYPLITVAHGGPASHFDNAWLTSYSNPGQLAAGQGYFVFYPNYRGSTGRGLKFAESNQGDMAGGEFDDIVQGVSELVTESIADSARLGVTGGSYGGYATAWLSTRYTNLFSAGVMLAGISDNISKWGTSDIPQELFLVHARKHVWDDYQTFLKSSPIYYAGETKTPLLIAAGKKDTRVDPSQSYELYRHIKTRTNTPVRLVLYPGEGHGNRNASARYDYNLRMMRWFDRYLKGDKKRPDAEVKTPKSTTK